MIGIPQNDVVSLFCTSFGLQYRGKDRLAPLKVENNAVGLVDVDASELEVL